MPKFITIFFTLSLWAVLLPAQPVFPPTPQVDPPPEILEWSKSPDGRYALGGRPATVESNVDGAAYHFSGTEFVIIRVSDGVVLPFPGESPLGIYHQGSPSNEHSKSIAWSSDSSKVAFVAMVGNGTFDNAGALVLTGIKVLVFKVSDDGLVDLGFSPLSTAESLAGKFPDVTPAYVYKAGPNVTGLELLDNDRISISQNGRYGGKMVAEPFTDMTCNFRSTIIYSLNPKVGPKVLLQDVHVDVH